MFLIVVVEVVFGLACEQKVVVVPVAQAHDPRDTLEHIQRDEKNQNTNARKLPRTAKQYIHKLAFGRNTSVHTLVFGRETHAHTRFRVVSRLCEQVLVQNGMFTDSNHECLKDV